MRETSFQIGQIPALLCGDEADKVYLFVHGRHGCKEEGRAFAEAVGPLGWQVLAIDLPEHGERTGETGFDPWHAVPELQAVMAWAVNAGPGPRCGPPALAPGSACWRLPPSRRKKACSSRPFWTWSG